MDCLFCNIVSGKIPCQSIFENDELLAFGDIRPAAPTHLLIIPKAHIASIQESTEADAALLGRMLLKAKDLATQMGIDEQGYRLVFNINSHGGQQVYHLHLHLLGGRQMTWPPG